MGVVDPTEGTGVPCFAVAVVVGCVQPTALVLAVAEGNRAIPCRRFRPTERSRRDARRRRRTTAAPRNPRLNRDIFFTIFRFPLNLLLSWRKTLQLPILEL